MSKGYFYFHNNTPVIATEEKPDETSFYYQANGTHLVHAEYYEAMEEWERQLIPVNWEAMSHDDFKMIVGDYKLRVEQMDVEMWWWEVYFQDTSLAFWHKNDGLHAGSELSAKQCAVDFLFKKIISGCAIEYEGNVITKKTIK